ncbi:hypothetical protein GCM10010448_52240 [Streptomyces glomeratus]|uniref:Uncharacterized protein n=1 Tax=Streptomyces glomeratus TaxID=284452 RepID=A0ABP6LVX3_9ACTN
MTGSAALRFGVFHAGVASAEDPEYTVVPQRERLERRSPLTAGPTRVHPAASRRARSATPAASRSAGRSAAG